MSFDSVRRVINQGFLKPGQPINHQYIQSVTELRRNLQTKAIEKAKLENKDISSMKPP